MKKLLYALLTLTAGGVAYTAWPVYSAYAIYDAYQRDDAAELDARIDFDSLRQSLGPQLEAQIAARAGADASPMATNMMKMGVSRMLAGMSGESVVAFKGGGSALRQLFPQASEDGARPSRPDVQWAFFTSPTRFEVGLGQVSIAMRLDGLTWRFYEVTLPPPPAVAAPPGPTEPIDPADLGLQELEGLEDLE